MMLSPGNRYLFDTTVFIDERHSKSVARQLISDARTLRLDVGYSIITEAELWVGIRASNLRTEAEHKILLAPFRRFNLNVSIARRAGELRGKLVETKQVERNQPPYLNDCLVAATAEFYGLTICTKNRKDFELFRQYNISVLPYS
jgi:predicted nucleic acid-binding protein